MCFNDDLQQIRRDPYWQENKQTATNTSYQHLYALQISQILLRLELMKNFSKLKYPILNLEYKKCDFCVAV